MRRRGLSCTARAWRPAVGARLARTLGSTNATLTVPTSFTPRQGQYLAFIYCYTKVNRQPPSESDIQRFFSVSAPSVHQMIVALERAGHIERKPGQARSVRVLVSKEELPELE